MAKKCDVCGTLYEQQCTPDVRINVYSHPYGNRWLDLCPKCQEKLERFIGGKSGKSNNRNREEEWCRNFRADMIDGGHNVYD